MKKFILNHRKSDQLEELSGKLAKELEKRSFNFTLTEDIVSKISRKMIDGFYGTKVIDTDIQDYLLGTEISDQEDTIIIYLDNGIKVTFKKGLEPKDDNDINFCERNCKFFKKCKTLSGFYPDEKNLELSCASITVPGDYAIVEIEKP